MSWLSARKVKNVIRSANKLRIENLIIYIICYFKFSILNLIKFLTTCAQETFIDHVTFIDFYWLCDVNMCSFFIQKGTWANKTVLRNCKLCRIWVKTWKRGSPWNPLQPNSWRAPIDFLVFWQKGRQCNTVIPH